LRPRTNALIVLAAMPSTAAAHLFALTTLSTLLAQAPLPVGVRDVAWSNPTAAGSGTLAARVLYPATANGTNTPLLPQPGGWPVVVFLHGFAVLGNSYQSLGTTWAQQGCIVVLSNTAQFDNVGQEADGRALFPAITIANNAAGPLQGAFDVQRMALAGHSMGGGNVANVLAQNPGYRGGVAIAPVPPRGNNGALVQTPLGIVAGAGDTITPPASNATPYYQSLTAYRGCKFLYLLNGDASHTNLAGLFVSGATATAVFQRSAAVAFAGLQHVLAASPSALEQALGPAALAEPRLLSLTQQFAEPLVWTSAPLALGASLRASVGMEPGIGGLAAAFAPPVGPIATPLGELRLDPNLAFVLAAGVVGSERRFDVPLTLPADPVLVGAPLSLQGLGPSVTQPLQFGSALGLSVLP
jgi:dienelactone hydrolase